MPVHFDKIQVGSVWERREPARLWGYKTFHAIARGVVTPRSTNFILLFAQEEKPDDFTQYDDRLAGRQLQWEGEKQHKTDHRIANAERGGDEIHVFYRKQHRARFTYLGRVRLLRFEHRTIEPSRARFELID